MQQDLFVVDLASF